MQSEAKSGEASIGLEASGSPLQQVGAEEERRLRERMRHRHRGGDSGASDFDDLYQEAWCKLLTGEARGRRTQDLRYALEWALRTCRVDEYRTRSRTPHSCPLDLVAERPASAAARPDIQAESREVAGDVLVALTRLPEPRGRLVVLSDICGLQPREVRAQLGLSPRQFQRQHGKAREEMASRLRRHTDHLTPVAA